jgi:transcriptional regulator with XRE-family HTH domain
MTLREVFVANLKAFRKKAHVSQMKLAEFCGSSASYIGEIEIGRKFPSVEMIERIAAALHVEAYKLFMEAQSRDPENLKARAYYALLSPEERDAFVGLFGAIISQGLEDALSNPPSDDPEELKRILSKSE